MSDLRLPRINRVMLSGRVTRDFVLRYTTDDVPVATFAVAFNRPVRQEGGGWTEVEGFVNVLVSHKLAEQCAERLRKGSPLYLEGRLQMRKVATGDGAGRTTLEIKADRVEFLERVPHEAPPPPPQRPVEGDLPF